MFVEETKKRLQKGEGKRSAFERYQGIRARAEGNLKRAYGSC